jgi:U3 small nucleolar RNA-associated protein 20
VPLISYHLSASDPKATYTLLRRSLTALIHHVKNAEQISLIGDIFVERLLSILNEVNIAKEEDMECLRRMLEATAVLCGVRQGSRLTRRCIFIPQCYLC